MKAGVTNYLKTTWITNIMRHSRHVREKDVEKLRSGSEITSAATERFNPMEGI